MCVKPITKYAVTVLEPETIKYHLQRAVYLAQTGRPGPVWIDIPLDVQGAMIDENALHEFRLSEENLQDNDDKLGQQVEKVVNLLNASERPVILAGNGIRLAKAEKEFLHLIETSLGWIHLLCAR